MRRGYATLCSYVSGPHRCAHAQPSGWQRELCSVMRWTPLRDSITTSPFPPAISVRPVWCLSPGPIMLTVPMSRIEFCAFVAMVRSAKRRRIAHDRETAAPPAVCDYWLTSAEGRDVVLWGPGCPHLAFRRFHTLDDWWVYVAGAALCFARTHPVLRPWVWQTVAGSAWARTSLGSITSHPSGGRSSTVSRWSAFAVNCILRSLPVSARPGAKQAGRARHAAAQRLGPLGGDHGSPITPEVRSARAVSEAFGPRHVEQDCHSAPRALRREQKIGALPHRSRLRFKRQVPFRFSRRPAVMVLLDELRSLNTGLPDDVIVLCCLALADNGFRSVEEIECCAPGDLDGICHWGDEAFNGLGALIRAAARPKPAKPTASGRTLSRIAPPCGPSHRCAVAALAGLRPAGRRLALPWLASAGRQCMCRLAVTARRGSPE